MVDTLKQRVRVRMAATGETYTQAKQSLHADTEARRATARAGSVPADGEALVVVDQGAFSEMGQLPRHLHSAETEARLRARLAPLLDETGMVEDDDAIAVFAEAMGVAVDPTQACQKTLQVHMVYGADALVERSAEAILADLGARARREMALLGLDVVTDAVQLYWDDDARGRVRFIATYEGGSLSQAERSARGRRVVVDHTGVGA